MSVLTQSTLPSCAQSARSSSRLSPPALPATASPEPARQLEPVRPEAAPERLSLRIIVIPIRPSSVPPRPHRAPANIHPVPKLFLHYMLPATALALSGHRPLALFALGRHWRVQSRRAYARPGWCAEFSIDPLSLRGLLLLLTSCGRSQGE